jgi:hypothetical protein
MKKIFFYIISIVFIVSTGCNDDSGGSTITDPFGGGTGGTGGGSVSFTMGSITKQEDGDGDGNIEDIFYFTATPSVAVKMTKVTFSLPAQQYNNSITDDGTTTYAANTPVDVVGFFKNEITTGQQWTFQFEGTLAADGKAFNVTSNYTVP